jgi:hypothetical protein
MEGKELFLVSGLLGGAFLDMGSLFFAAILGLAIHTWRLDWEKLGTHFEPPTYFEGSQSTGNPQIPFHQLSPRLPIFLRSLETKPLIPHSEPNNTGQGQPAATKISFLVNTFILKLQVCSWTDSNHQSSLKLTFA